MMADEQRKYADERKRMEEATRELQSERKRMEDERAKNAVPAKPRNEPPKQIARAASEPPPVKTAPAPVPSTVVPAPAPVSTPTAQPSGEAQLLASAERAQARRDYGEAAAILKPLAERGNARAMLRLGDQYLAGQGVEKNDELALRMFRGASDRGDGEAHQRLGDMYTKGRGVPQNNFQAYAFYVAAAQCGNALAKADAERVGATLQPVEIQQALKLSQRIARAKEC